MSLECGVKYSTRLAGIIKAALASFSAPSFPSFVVGGLGQICEVQFTRHVGYLLDRGNTCSEMGTLFIIILIIQNVH